LIFTEASIFIYKHTYAAICENFDTKNALAKKFNQSYQPWTEMPLGFQIRVGKQ
jgi:hypothetical protein